MNDLAYQKEYRKNNKDAIAKKNRHYRKTHKLHEQERQLKYKKTPKGKFFLLRWAAKRKHLEVSINLEDYCTLISSGVCRYCKSELPSNGYHIDRIDNRLGYIHDNCVPCCRSCNNKKGWLEAAGFYGARAVELLQEVLCR